MRPPFEITPRAIGLLSGIERVLGKHEGALAAPPSPMLRRSLKVRTIHASVAIEGNALTEEQVTAVLEGKRVVAPAGDLLEVKNAIACYEKLPTWNPGSPKHFLAAHKVMMKGLVDRPGSWRTGGVGIAKGNLISHVAPPASRAPGLVASLLEWVKKDKEVPTLVRAAVCHYELGFIHPFQDGNGRMGRLWHSLILSRYHQIFSHVPVESAVRQRQADYYEVLGRCDKAGNSTEFVEFALQATLEALETVTSASDRKMTSAERIDDARIAFADRWFSRRDYLGRFPSLSSATASRDLKAAVDEGSVEREGDKATSRYRFVP